MGSTYVADGLSTGRGNFHGLFWIFIVLNAVDIEPRRICSSWESPSSRQATIAPRRPPAGPYVLFFGDMDIVVNNQIGGSLV